MYFSCLSTCCGKLSTLYHRLYVIRLANCSIFFSIFSRYSKFQSQIPLEGFPKNKNPLGSCRVTAWAQMVIATHYRMSSSKTKLHSIYQ